jgi:hypothetical protein
MQSRKDDSQMCMRYRQSWKHPEKILGRREMMMNDAMEIFAAEGRQTVLEQERLHEEHHTMHKSVRQRG